MLWEMQKARNLKAITFVTLCTFGVVGYKVRYVSVVIYVYTYITVDIRVGVCTYMHVCVYIHMYSCKLTIGIYKCVCGYIYV